jgi:hypothetical protein
MAAQVTPSEDPVAAVRRYIDYQANGPGDFLTPTESSQELAHPNPFLLEGNLYCGAGNPRTGHLDGG